MASYIAQNILNGLLKQKEQPAVYFGTSIITGDAFHARILQFAKALKCLKQHEHIAIMMQTSPDALALFIASLTVFKNTFVFDANWPVVTSQKIAQFSNIEILVCDKAMEGTNCVTASCLLALADEKSASQQKAYAPDNPAFTFFTSGSTGTPKGCVRSEQSWISSFEADRIFTKIGPDCTVIAPGSFSHSLAIYAVIRGLYEGAKIAIFPKFYPPRILKLMAQINNCIMFAVPTQLSALTKAAYGKCFTLKQILLAGSKLSKSIAANAQEIFPNADLIEFYGTTELSYVAARQVKENDPGTLVGTLLEGVELSVRQHDGTPCPTGSKGLIHASSNMAFTGYLTEEGMRPASPFICVGDVGWLDENGALHLAGRMDRMFQSSGRNIVPETIEDALMKIMGIEMVAIFGEPDPVRENRIVAIIGSDKISKKHLIERLRYSLPSYAIPNIYYACHDWPWTTSGKTDLLKLQMLLENKALDVLEA